MPHKGNRTSNRGNAARDDQPECQRKLMERREEYAEDHEREHGWTPLSAKLVKVSPKIWNRTRDHEDKTRGRERDCPTQ